MVFMTSLTFKVQANSAKATADSILVYGVSKQDKGPVLLGNAAKDSATKSLNLKALQVTGTAESFRKPHQSA